MVVVVVLRLASVVRCAVDVHHTACGVPVALAACAAGAGAVCVSMQALPQPLTCLMNGAQALAKGSVLHPPWRHLAHTEVRA